MTPGDGVPDDASPSQILLEMWVYAQEGVNASEEQTKSSQMAQVKKNKSSKGKRMLIQHMLDVNMLVRSSNSSQESQDTDEKPYSFNTSCMSTCLAAKTV